MNDERELLNPMTTLTDPSDRAVETGLGTDPDALAPDKQKSFAELGVDPPSSPRSRSRASTPRSPSRP